MAISYLIELTVTNVLQFLKVYFLPFLQYILWLGCNNSKWGLSDRRLSDRFAEHLHSVMNNDDDKPVERNFNAANHSISDIKICAISPISGSNDSRKRHEKRLIFVGTAVSGTHIVIVQFLSTSIYLSLSWFILWICTAQLRYSEYVGNCRQVAIRPLFIYTTPSQPSAFFDYRRRFWQSSRSLLIWTRLV